jgi:hypothetical protein
MAARRARASALGAGLGRVGDSTGLALVGVGDRACRERLAPAR